MRSCLNLIRKPITLPNGVETDNHSKDYMLYCEALNLSKRPLEDRRRFLAKLKDEERIKALKVWLEFIWNQKDL